MNVRQYSADVSNGDASEPWENRPGKEQAEFADKARQSL